MTRTQVAFFVGFLLLYLIFTAWSGYYFDDFHIANRMGATLSAIGALLIVVQVRREVQLEQSARADAEFRTQRLQTADDALVRSLMLKREEERYLQRMRIIFCIAILIFVGEILHGWGEIILERIIPSGH